MSPSRRAALNLRSHALLVLAALGLMTALHVAHDILVPVAAAVVVQFMVAPAMRTLCRWHLPPPLAAAVIVVGLAGALILGIYHLASPVTLWVDRLPEVSAQIKEKLRVVREPVEQVQKASEQVEAAAVGAQPGLQVTLRKPSLLEQVAGGILRMIVGIGVALVVLYFLLATGELFKFKLVRVIPRLEDKKRALTILTDIEHQVSRYLSTQTLINAGLGVSLSLVLWAMGMPNPGLWGLMVAVLNFIPFFGFIVAASVITAVAIASFDSLAFALMAPGAYAALKITEGNFVAPSVLGHSLTLNPLVIILSLLFWGWLWGPAGALLAVPLLVIAKTVCDRIDRFATIGQFISGDRH